MITGAAARAGFIENHSTRRPAGARASKRRAPESAPLRYPHFPPAAMQRRTLLIAATTARPPSMRALVLETKLTIAVGGKEPAVLPAADHRRAVGLLQGRGLDVTIADFAGGSRALRAVVGGSADVVSGAFEHAQHAEQRARRCVPSCYRGARRRSCWASTRRRCRATVARRPEGQEDRRDGAGLVDQRDGELRARQGRHQAERRVDRRCRRGARRGGGDARRGQIDAISNLDPVITLLALGRPEDHLRHAHRRRGADQGLRRADAGDLDASTRRRPSSTSTRPPCRRGPIAHGCARQVDRRAPARRDHQGHCRRPPPARRPRGLHRRLHGRQGALSPDGLFPGGQRRPRRRVRLQSTSTRR